MPVYTSTDIHAIGADDLSVKAEVVVFDHFTTLTVTIGGASARFNLPSVEVAEQVVDAVNLAMRHPRRAMC
jgi:hypothetical protein